MDGNGALDRHQTRNRDGPHDLPLTLATHGTFWSARFPSDRRRKWSHHDQAMKIRWQRLKLNHDRGSRSWFDSGLITPRSGLIQRQIQSHDTAKWRAMITVRSWPSNRSHDRIKSGPNFRDKIPFKKTMYPSLFLQLLIDLWRNSANFEEGPKFFVIPPRLESIAKQLERDWSRIPLWFYRIFPLNSERTRGRNRANSLQSTRIEATFLRQLG